MVQVRKSDVYLVQLHVQQSDLRFSTVRVMVRVRIRVSVRVRDPTVGRVVAQSRHPTVTVGPGDTAFTNRTHETGIVPPTYQG